METGGAARAGILALARAPWSEEQEAADLIIIQLCLPGDAIATKSGIQTGWSGLVVRPGGHKLGASLEKREGWFNSGVRRYKAICSVQSSVWGGSLGINWGQGGAKRGFWACRIEVLAISRQL